MGSNFHKPLASNVSGLYEDLRLVEINESILKMCDSDWDTKIPVKLTRKANDYANQRYDEYISSKDSRVVWGLKDPRLTLLIETLHPKLQKPFYVICHRDRTSIAKSLYVRNGFATDTSNAISLVYEDSMKKFLGNNVINKYVVQYEELCSSPDLVTNNLIKLIGLDVSAETISNTIGKVLNNDKLAKRKTNQIFTDMLNAFKTALTNPSKISAKKIKIYTHRWLRELRSSFGK